jgi:hypothetical protein
MSIRPATLLLTALLLPASGCAWVKLTEAGQRVRVIDHSSSLSAGCVRKGEITASVRRELGPFERNSQKVTDELEALARNEAALISADTVVPTGPVDGSGQRRYVAYDCGGR